MKTRYALTVVALISAVAVGLLHAGSLKQYRGHIIAYRVGDRVLQASSHVENSELFLFQKEPTKKTEDGRIVILRYRHFGLSKISSNLLDTAPLLQVQLKRNSGCDKRYGEFPQTGTNAGESDRLKNLKFVEKFQGLRLNPDEMLFCYDLIDFEVLPAKVQR